MPRAQYEGSAIRRIRHMQDPAGSPRSPRPPVFDQDRVEHRVRLQRARRAFRIEQDDERRIARMRFWFVIASLLSLTIVIAAAVYHEIRSLFGL